jgi:hypothetical protein
MYITEVTVITNPVLIINTTSYLYNLFQSHSSTWHAETLICKVYKLNTNYSKLYKQIYILSSRPILTTFLYLVLQINHLQIVFYVLI